MGFVGAFWRGFSRRIKGKRETSRASEVSGGADGPPVSDVIKEPPLEIDGRVMSAGEFVAYVETLEFVPPLPTRVFLHHTWRPTRAEWRGIDSILAMKAYYEQQIWEDSHGQLHEGWTAAPHLFVADDGIWLFSDLRRDGVGVYGHNYRSRHIEMVGNYDQQLPSGPTLTNTIAALGILHERLGLDTADLNFHREFSTKSCPGWAVYKGWIVPQVAEWVGQYRRERSESVDPLRRALVRMVEQLLVPLNSQTALAKGAATRGLLGALTHEIPISIDEQAYIVQLFAEALLVPVNRWDDVETLADIERRGQDERRGGAASDAGDNRIGLPPLDPYRFEGRVR